MLTGVAFVRHQTIHAPGAWVLVFAVLLIVALIFVRVYGRRGG